MKNIFSGLKVFVGVIAVLVFASGIVLTGLGAYDMVIVFTKVGDTDEHHLADVIAIGLLRVIDLFLISIVFFVLAIGILLLFTDPEKGFPVNLPHWLRIKNFMELKSILWEAILTTLVIVFLTDMAGKKINGVDPNANALIIPGGILLIALSLFFLQKGKHE